MIKERVNTSAPTTTRISLISSNIESSADKDAEDTASASKKLTEGSELRLDKNIQVHSNPLHLYDLNRQNTILIAAMKSYIKYQATNR